MSKKIMAAIIAICAILGASQGIETFEVVEDVSPPDRRKRITGRHLRRFLRGLTLPDEIVNGIKRVLKGPGIVKRWATRASRKFDFYFGPGGLHRSIAALTALLILSCMAIPQSMDPLGINPLGGCWHSADSGVNKEAYGSALYKEAWGTDTSKAFNVNHLQSIVTDISPSSTSGSILLKRSTVTKFTITFSGGNISVNGGGTIDTYTPDTTIKLQLIPDMIESKVTVYIDGVLVGREDFAAGEVCNSLDTISRTGTFTTLFDIYVADSLDNIALQFSDSLNEDTLSDYTLGGDTNPTYDSTEKAIELRDVTNLANQTSIAYQDFDCPQDEITFKFQAKIGTNDSSTDGRLMDVRLRSKIDTDTYVAVYYNGANIFLENVIDGAVSGTGNIAVALGNTSHDFEVIIRLQSHVYLFIDTIEYVEITPTKIKRFYDGQGYFQSQHDAGEESEIFIKNIAVNDSPTVNAPRSTPPGLLTSGTRVDAGNTFWSDYAGEWSAVYGDTTNIAMDEDGLYGRRIKYDNNSTQLISTVYYAGLQFTPDADVIIGSAHTLKITIEIDNVTNIDRNRLYISDKDSNSMFYDLGIGITAGKMVTYTIDLNSPVTGIWTGSIEQMLTQVRYSSDQTVNMYISDMYFIGEPEHDVRGQPLYTNAGVDDIDEWALSGDTNPVWNAGASAFEMDHTNIGGGVEHSTLSRSIKFNPNGVGVANFSYQIQATDTNTYAGGFVFEIQVSATDVISCYYDPGGQDWTLLMKSNNVTHYTSNVAFTKDNAWHDVNMFFHKDHGITMFIDEKQYNLDTSITGTWTEWPSITTLDIYVQNTTIGQRAHVFVKDISIERYPYNIHQFQSNEWFAATDTLSPNTGTDIDGDWISNIGGINVQATGGSLHNGKWIQLPGAGAGDYMRYEFDSAMDIRGFKYLHGFCYHTGAVPASIIFHMHTDAANYYTCTVTTKGWSFHEKLTPTDGSNGDFGVNGVPDPSSIAYVEINQNIGAPHTIGVQGLQFVSEQYANESFIPQILKVKDNSIDAGKYGALYHPKGEKARVYLMEIDGYWWGDQNTLVLLDIYGAGFKGEGTWQSKFNTMTVQTETDTFSFGITFWEGTWKFPLACAFDHIRIVGRGGVEASYDNIGTLGDCSVDDGILSLNTPTVAHIYADSIQSHTADLPTPQNWGIEARLEDGIVLDDGICQYRLITCANGTQWDIDHVGPIKWASFAVEGTGYFSVYDLIALETIGIKFNGAEVEDNTVAAGKFIEALGGGSSWTVTRREGDHLYGYPADAENIRDWINLADWINLLDYIDKR